jgi:hypothetical protein
MKIRVLGGLIVWAGVSAACAQEVVRQISWTDLQAAGQLNAGQIASGGPTGQLEQLKVENPTDEPKTVTVLDMENPGIKMYHYAMEGSVRYENVKGKGYLEMWNWFADGGMYFSRTLGDSGPMQALEGSSDWRPFSLPFFSSAKSGVPKRIVVNVVFAGRGTVWLSPPKLLQYDGDGLAEESQRGRWWPRRTGSLIGTVGGLVIGFLGGLIGTLGGMGRARSFVLRLTATLIGIGVLSLIAGVVAVMVGQPFAVYFPLLLIGIILTAVCGGNLPALRRRYEQIELRKMAAMDSR